MDTATFLARVLPRGGNKILAERFPFTDKKTGRVRDAWRYTTFQSFDAMAEAVEQFDEQARTIYHACNAYGDWYVDPSNNKRRIRTGVNVVACRSLFEDIDVGKENCYATKKEAATAIKEFVKATGLPMPLVVDSGNGIHLYWVLDEDVSPEEWLELSALKRRATTHFGLKVDHSVDLDKARVLRPVGTHNRKSGEPKLVSAKNNPSPSSPAVIRSVLEAYVSDNQVDEIRVPTGRTQNAFAALRNEYPDSYADVVAAHCASVRWFKETGAPDEPAWHKLLGAILHCVDGPEKIHEWSSAYAGYNEFECQQKIDAWSFGPATCEAIKTVCGSCAGCTAECKAPITLGRVVETKPVEVEVEVAKAQERTSAAETPKTQEELIKSIWPQGYSVRNGAMCYSVADDNGVVHNLKFCDTVFYPVELHRQEDGTWATVIEYIAQHGEKRRFSMPTSDISSTDKLASALAAHTIWLYGKNGKMCAQDAVRQMCRDLQFHEQEQEIKDAFGWNAERTTFTIGGLEISNTGEREVLLSQGIHSAGMAADYGVSGSRDEWVRIVDEVYNRPGAEPFQFAFLAAAAAPLVDILDIQNFRGIPIAYTGDGGRGKTTAAVAACSMWGREKYMKQSASKAATTVNALLARLAIYKNLPFVLDELTGHETNDMVHILYALSNGQEKARADSKGNIISGSKKWGTIAFFTGNDNITDMLGTMEKQVVAEAVSVRCFEIRLPGDYIERVFAGVNGKELIEGELSKHYGTVGRELLAYYIAHKDELRQKILRLRAKYVPNTADEARERFYMDLIVLCDVVGHIMHKLGIVNFDIDGIRRWAFSNVKSLRVTRSSQRYSEDDLIAQYLSSLHGHIIVTKQVRDLRYQAPEVPLEVPRFDPLARQAVEEKKFYITAKSMKDWCKEHEVQPSVLRDSMDKQGYIMHVAGRDSSGGFNHRLGSGTNLTTGMSRCYELDYAKVYGSEAVAATNVTPISVARSVASSQEPSGESAVTC